MNQYADRDQISPGSHLDDFGHESSRDPLDVAMDSIRPKSTADYWPIKKARRQPHPSLSEYALQLIQDGFEWTETGLATALIQKFREQGRKRITERLREDCMDAAKTALAMYAETIRK